jgi:hypothetical protein
MLLEPKDLQKNLRTLQRIFIDGEKQLNNNELSDGEVQLSILTLLFNIRRKQPKDPEVRREKIIEVLGLPEDRIEFNAEYLKEKRLIEILGAYMGGWCWAKITALGIDAINNKEERKRTFNFLGLKIPIHIENKIALINIDLK